MRVRGLLLTAGLLAALAACGEKPATPQKAEVAETAPLPQVPKDATIRDIMASLADPSGDFLFESFQDIANDNGVTHKQPQTDAEWAEVKRHLNILIEASRLVSEPGRKSARPEDRSENPEVELQPEQVQKLMDANPADFVRRAGVLRDAAQVGLQAADAKDRDAMMAALLKIDHACEACHLTYWYPNDKRAWQAAREEGLVP